MSKTTIEWTNRVWNFLTGCTKISTGCKNCYMFVLAHRLKGMGNPMYRNGHELTIHEQKINLPYSIKKPSMFFVNSMSDMFHQNVPLSILKAAFEVMNKTPQHVYQILTKRPERLFELQQHFKFTPNIWIGVSVEDEKVLHRIDTLREINCEVRWISAEPLIGPLTNLNLDGISWVVVGGESGISRNIRPVNESWIFEIMDKCRKKAIPFFFKQWGKPRFNPNALDPTIPKTHPQHAKGGCQLQGKIYREFPLAFKSLSNEAKINTKGSKEKLIVKSTIENLTPFKKAIAEELLKGEKPETIVKHITQERKMPNATAKAYVTMVINYLAKINLLNLENTSKVKMQIKSKRPSIKKIIANALATGERPEELATRLAFERKIPRPSAQAYVTMVVKMREKEKQKS